MQIRDEFFKELNELRARYPMVYLKVFTPDDFFQTNNGPDSGGKLGVADWRDEDYVRVARNLEKLGEGQTSGDWLLIRKATLEN
jgi:hypothetical protein